MNDLLNSTIDNKNIGLLKNLWELRQALDVYELISANAKGINERGIGRNFFGFLRASCLHLITLYICKVFEAEEKPDKQGKVKHELSSIDGVLKSSATANLNVLDPKEINGFVRQYSHGQCGDGTLSAISLTVRDFKARYKKELKRFQEARDKWGAHSEFGFSPEDLPSYDIMERLFDFGHDFYRLVYHAFITCVVPCDLNADRKVKASLKKVFEELGIKEIRTEMK